MTATMQQMASGLEERLASIKGLRVSDHVPDVFAPPCAFVMPENIDYWQAFQGGDATTRFTITAVVGRVSDRAAQRNLYEMMAYSGTRSVRAAVEADRSLGGRVQTCIVESASNIRAANQGEAEYLAVDFSVRIHP
jgi:hypothetical protein